MLKIQPTAVSRAAQLLRRGGVLALPTETVFGLAVSANSEAGVNRLIKLKDRALDSGKVFTLIPVVKTDFPKYARVEGAEDLIAKYVPGQITLLLRKNPAFHHFYFDHFDTIGLRIPDFKLFEELLPLSGPLLLTSANRRGEPTLDSLAKIKRTFPELDGYVDEDCGHQLASVIVQVDERGNRAIIRRGGLELNL